MLTITEYAKVKGWSRTYVWKLLRLNRIEGAQRHGGDGNRGIWLIPENAKVKPK